ncbi:MAG: hypothetical protein QUS14_01685 [Pyrinomonadaceae bacterium]|nr:hypothetical protein [Pyrinomonadaceae bacterium]
MEQNVETDNRGRTVGPLKRRRETMEDGRRYIIYFTFGDTDRETSLERASSKSGEKEDV